MLTLVRLREHQSTVVSGLTNAQAAAIAAALGDVSITPTSTEGTFEITPGSVVGSMNLSGLEVHISPKVDLLHMLFMISYAVDPKHWRDDVASFETSDLVVEAIAPAFIRMVRAAVKRGLLCGYRNEQDSLLTVRGRMMIGEQLRRRHGILVPLEVNFDEYTADILENQLLKAGLCALSRVSIRSSKVASLLHHAIGLFDHVQLRRWPKAQVPSVRYSRLNEHYRPAIELARLLMGDSSFDVGSGIHQANCFLLDMNTVFEAFVYRALREALRVDESVFRRGAHGLSLDTSERVRLVPDLSWWYKGDCCFVGDVKYKQLDQAGFKHADMYQMLAYLTATGLRHSALIYAGAGSSLSTFVFRGSSSRVDVHTLGLSQCPEGILSEVAKIATSIREKLPGNVANIERRNSDSSKPSFQNATS